MSTDEITFGEVKYREPVRMTPPNRDRRWACASYEVPRVGDMPIFLDCKPADAIERHALRDVSVELGGILLGRECIDNETGEPFVLVLESLEAKHYENTQASFTYTHDSWQEITRERDRLYPDLDIVGWYHTHPDFGIFLSGHDLFIHRNFFDQPLQVAYVVDPIRQTRGFFRWKSGGLEQVGGYHLIAGRDQRATISRLLNNLEGIPNNNDSGGGSGGGLSPRLEAELINMLTRTPHFSAPAQDRGQIAALAGFAGLIVGLGAFAIALWINSLNQQVHDQADRVKELGQVLQSNTEMQRMALHALSTKGDIGKSGDDLFTTAYKKALAERDSLEVKIERLAYINDQLATDGKAMRGQIDETAKKLKKAEAEVQSSAADAKESVKLRTDLESARSKLLEQKETIDRKVELLSATDETKAAELLTKSKTSFYLAIAGWLVALLLASALALLWANGYIQIDLRDSDRNAPPDAPHGESAPHVIN